MVLRTKNRLNICKHLKTKTMSEKINLHPNSRPKNMSLIAPTNEDIVRSIRQEKAELIAAYAQKLYKGIPSTYKTNPFIEQRHKELKSKKMQFEKSSAVRLSNNVIKKLDQFANESKID